MKIQEIVRNSAKIPAWAIDADAEEWGGYPYECHILSRGGADVGYVYDDGAGYQFAQGENNRPAADYIASIGDKVQTGEGSDHDTGTVLKIDENKAFVGWRSGVKTWIPIADLLPV